MGHGIITLVLIVLLASVALTQRQAPPPTIAEFAPQAVEQITGADRALGGGSGAGSGQQEQSDPASDLARGRGVVDVARVRQCVGDPPRQIEDPQSPPCVPYWSGDNGGATAKGVTRDEVRLVWNKYGAGPAECRLTDPNRCEGDRRYFDALTAFFNRRFEFYGRRIRVIAASSPCDWFSDEPQEAYAVEADEQLNAFAAFGDCIFKDEVFARRGIIFVNIHGTGSYEMHKRWHPYLWTYDIETEKQFRMFGSWVCSRLTGRNAEFAGTPDLQGRRRVFGLFFSNLEGEHVDDKPIADALAACGEKWARRVQYDFTNEKSSDQYYADMANIVLQMREAGVTSLATFAHAGVAWQLAWAASAQGYVPEWLNGSFILWDGGRPPLPEQWDHAFGVLFHPKLNTPEKMPSYWATSETDPGLTVLSEWAYHHLLLLASGIQLAGPNLTPHTFAAGLHRTAFPNPDHPIMAGKVGFTDGDYGMVEDATEVWWDSYAPHPWRERNIFGPRGTWCYIDGGARATSWPNQPSKAFQEPCITS